MLMGYRKTTARSKRTKKSLISTINITPFVDIILVLLIVFMITSPMLNNGFNVNLPKVNSNQIKISQNQKIIFTIDKHRNIRVDEKVLKLSEIPSYLSSYNAIKSQIFIRGDKNTDYGAVMNLMGVLHKNGFNNISLITDTLNK